MYAIDVWCIPVHGTVAGQRRKGSVEAVRQLTKIQRAGAIAITGGLRTSPTDSLEACAHLLPVTQLIEKWCFRAAVRLATIPPEHPLYKVVKASANRKIVKHKSPLHELMQVFKLNPTSVTKIAAAVRNPLDANQTPMRISIASSKEASITEDTNAQEIVKVYSDGSEINGKVGAAAVMLKPGNPTRVLHFCLGNDTEHTVQEAELVGLLLGVHLIKTEKKGNTTFALGTDNQAAIKALSTDLVQPGQKIALKLLETARSIHKKRGTAKYSLTVRWTAGHSGIKGNEKADKEAKLAAAGATSNKKLLPPLLRRKLTANPAALKRKRNKTIKEAWKTNWRSSPHGVKMAEIDDTTPSDKVLKTISGNKLSRKASSILAQICTGHFPLNGYLYRFKRVDNPRCPACGAAVETLHHFLFTCRSYAYMRWPLEQKCKGTLTLKKIFVDRKLIALLIRYINATGRFSQNGEYNT
jgi:ribonuclease HI